MENNIVRTAYSIGFNASKKNKEVLEHLLEEQQKRKEEIKNLIETGKLKKSNVVSGRIKSMVKRMQADSKYASEDN